MHTPGHRRLDSSLPVALMLAPIASFAFPPVAFPFSSLSLRSLSPLFLSSAVAFPFSSLSVVCYYGVLCGTCKRLQPNPEASACSRALKRHMQIPAANP